MAQSRPIWLVLLALSCTSDHLGNPADGDLPGCEWTSSPLSGLLNTFACPLGRADGAGTRSDPVDSLDAALQLSNDPMRIHLAGGQYAGSATVSGREVTVVAGQDARLDSDGIALTLTAGATVSVKGLHFSRSVGAAILSRDSALNLTDVSIDDTQPMADGSFGLGLVVLGGEVQIEGLTVTDTSSVGVLVRDAVGSISDLTIEDCDAGLRLEQVADLVVSRASILRSGSYGVGLFDASAALDQITVEDASADGIVASATPGAAPHSQITLREPTLTNNGRIGLLVDGGASVSVEAGTIESNARSGAWVQDSGASGGLTLAGTAVAANTFTGLNAVAGGRLVVHEADVSETAIGELEYFEGIDLRVAEVGDGLSVSADCDAEIVNSRFADNGRLGIVVSQARAQLTRNTIEGNPRAIVLQEVGDAVQTEDNTLENNDVNVVEVDVDPVRLLSAPVEVSVDLINAP